MITKTFAYIDTRNKNTEKINQLRQAYSRLKALIDLNVMCSREQACSLTSLEQSFLWAVRAVEMNDPTNMALTSTDDGQSAPFDVQRAIDFATVLGVELGEDDAKAILAGLKW